MELWEAMEKRFSYRGKYTGAPVPHADLEQLLHAGLIAPSGCNRQTPQFLAIDDPVLLKKIATFFNMPNTDTATAGICVLSRPRAAIDGKSYAIQDYSGAIENILLAVTCLGYASCWLEGQTHAPGIAQQIEDLLQLPKDVHLAVYLPLGVPETPTPPKRSLAPNRAWINTYGKNPL